MIDPLAPDLAVLAPADRPGALGRLGRFRVLRVLGRGGVGVVFEAEDDALKRHVALKAMRPEVAADAGFRERFFREAAIAAKVEHDNIVPIYDIAEDKVPFLVMPLLVGETLDERLKASPPLTIPEVLAIGRQIADGLTAAHAAGLVHRDLKPSNVWLERTAVGAFKRARILDFGLARAVTDAGLPPGGAIVGTPAYMAPEQARGEQVDHRADLFSLGCVLYQLVTGQRPFRGNDTRAVLSALATDVPPAPKQVNAAVPVALSTLVELLLSKDPINRWPSTARDVSDELFRIIIDPLSASGARPGLPTLPPAVAAPLVPPAKDEWFEAADTESDEVPMATPVEPEPETEPTPAPRRRRGWVFAACAMFVALLALVAYLLT